MTTPFEPTAAEILHAAADRLHDLATTASTDNRGTPTIRWHFKERDGHCSGYLYAENPADPGVRLIQGGSSGPHGRGTHPGMRTRHGQYAAARTAGPRPEPRGAAPRGRQADRALS